MGNASDRHGVMDELRFAPGWLWLIPDPIDLGWERVDVVELEVKCSGENIFEAAWVGSLASLVNIPLRRPGQDANWRVAIDEWEKLPGDPADLGSTGTAAPRPVWDQRLVYADHVGL